VLNSSETATEVVDSADATKRRTQNQLVGGILTYGAVTAGSHLASLLPSVLGNGVRYGLASFLGQKQGESMAKTAAATQFTVMTTNVDYCGSDGATMREVVVVSEDDRDFIDSLQACVHAWRNGTLPEPVVLLLVAAKTSSLAPTPVEYNQLPDSQSAQQSNTHSQIPTTVGQNSKPQPSFSGIASRGEPDVAPANRVQQVSEGVVNVTGDYQSVYNALRQAMMDAGGTIKTDAMNTGIVEGAWKYGINAFGLRVTARFNTLPSGQIQVSIKGGFKDALDTFGTGRKKAIEITTAFLQKFPSSSASLSQQSSMPPPMPQYAQRMAAPSAPSGSTPYQGKTKMLAGILGLLLGGLGVHKFYLGSYGWGILYILSCWTFIPAIVGGVEGIIFLCMAQEHFDLRYNYTPPHPFKW
jgi:TM2 domain-containing membrane protein YozV